MEFTVTTSGFFYPDSKKSHRKKLEKLGFKFNPSEFREWSIDYDQNVKVEINTIEDLIQFTKKIR